MLSLLPHAAEEGQQPNARTIVQPCRTHVTAQHVLRNFGGQLTKAPVINQPQMTHTQAKLLKLLKLKSTILLKLKTTILLKLPRLLPAVP